ncbi:AcrR family transcriptional regulator [Agrobacterium vitis]|nr:AcrR family transcriptional regulator [Agrobacterium vitis]MBE1440236.1 AcrR family transcriptional regulator [Agrobacterium vitis]
MIDVKNEVTPLRRRGRPPAFDRAQVLARAGECFWRLGYEGASIVDLTTAMGITPQSLYAAFGSKADLYREALGWYGVAFATLTAESLDKPDPLGTLMAWMESQAKLFTDPNHPPGCMISTAVLGCAVENDPVAQMVSNMREATIARIRDRLERARAEGEMKPDADPNALARFVGAIIQGMSVQARDGASEAELATLARLAGRELARERR